jgi:acyl-CoA reductase-like NAD-dependent aldehyde dehydrogenase
MNSEGDKMRNALDRAENAIAENYDELWRLRTRENLLKAIAEDATSRYQEVARTALWIMDFADQR